MLAWFVHEHNCAFRLADAKSEYGLSEIPQRIVDVRRRHFDGRVTSAYGGCRPSGTDDPVREHHDLFVQLTSYKSVASGSTPDCGTELPMMMPSAAAVD